MVRALLLFLLFLFLLLLCSCCCCHRNFERAVIRGVDDKYATTVTLPYKMNPKTAWSNSSFVLRFQTLRRTISSATWNK
jgi:hypothetical protein